MSELGNNATPPGPAFAPGVEHIDPAEVAADCARRNTPASLRALIPTFDAPFFQAGLAGYSDAAMRIIARRHGCPFCVTEALLDRTLLAGGRGFIKADLGDLHDNIPGGPEDHPLACQIMGSDPDEMAAACLKVAEQGRRGDKHYRLLAYPDTGFPMDQSVPLRLPGGEQLPPNPFDATEGLGDTPDDDSCETIIDEQDRLLATLSVRSRASSSSLPRSLDPSIPRSLSFQSLDINLACPVKKIKSKSRGGHWLTDPSGAINILRAVRDAVPREVVCTVKMRRAFDDTPEMARNFQVIFDAAYELGYAWVTVHARTVEQKYIGPSRWTFLRDLVQRRPDRLIFGSGDIWDAADIFRMIGYTGVHAVSVARGCIGNPWLFRQARQMMAGEPPTPPTLAEQRGVLQDHFALSTALNGEDLAGRTMRKFGIRFAAHHPRPDDARKRFIAVTNLAAWRAVLADLY